MLPGAAGLFLAGRIGGPGRLAVEGLQGADLQLFELGPAVAVMGDRGIVDAENALIVERADDHGHGIAVEQQAERGLALLQFGDVDAQADDAAVVGQALVDQDDATVRQLLLVARTGLIELLQTFGDPLVLMTDGLGIVAAGDADAQRVFEARTFLEQIGGLAVDLGVFPVPEDVTAFGIEEHDPLRQDIDGLAQAFMGFARFRNRGFRLGTAAQDLVALDRVSRRARETRLARHPAGAGKHVLLSLFRFSRPQTQLHSFQSRARRPQVLRQVSEKKVILPGRGPREAGLAASLRGAANGDNRGQAERGAAINERSGAKLRARLNRFRNRTRLHASSRFSSLRARILVNAG